MITAMVDSEQELRGWGWGMGEGGGGGRLLSFSFPTGLSSFQYSFTQNEEGASLR